MKCSMTPSGIETTTFRFVEQRLNQPRHRIPHIYVCVCVTVIVEWEGGVSFNNSATNVALVTNSYNINKGH
jgi:hypothetical protein